MEIVYVLSFVVVRNNKISGNNDCYFIYGLNLYINISFSFVPRFVFYKLIDAL